MEDVIMNMNGLNEQNKAEMLTDTLESLQKIEHNKKCQ